MHQLEWSADEEAEGMPQIVLVRFVSPEIIGASLRSDSA